MTLFKKVFAQNFWFWQYPHERDIMEEWAPIPDFPGYLVSSEGYVQHERKGKDLTRFTNPSGGTYVGLTIGDRTYNRSLPLLVANAFLPPPPMPIFNTPINLNGNRSDNRADNLKWRPLWFARKYHRQFSEDVPYHKTPVVDLGTGEIFPNSWEAAIRYGFLSIDLVVAIANREGVWPTRQQFRLFDRPHTV